MSSSSERDPPDQPPQRGQPAQDETAREQQFGEWMKRYPRIVEMATEIGGGGGCDAHEEFEFALDLILDGLERIHRESARADG